MQIKSIISYNNLYEEVEDEQDFKYVNGICYVIRNIGSNVNPKSDIPENSNFEVHFIDVGQADSALIECDGETMMIDGENVADSNLVAAYLKKEDVTELNYVVCSHAHEDHVGGLSGALSVTKRTTYMHRKQRRIQKAYKISREKSGRTKC